MNKNHLITACVAIFGVLFTLPSARAETTAPQKIKVLIVDGFSNHDWKLTTALIRGILEPTGLFDVSVSTSPPKADSPGWDDWRPKFDDYDVVIQNCNDYGGGPPWPPQVQREFEDFVLKGGGVLAHHSANNAFPNWPAYNDMIGLLWRKKDQGTALSIDDNEKIVSIPNGEGENTGHGPRNDVLVHCLGEHPIHAGLPKSWLTPKLEVYYYTRGPAKNVDVLSYGYDPKTKMNWPIEWTVTYGQGRIYSSTFGHVWKGDVQPESMRCADEQLLLQRAIQWLAKRPITIPAPADFPTSEAKSIRPEIPLSRAPSAPLHVAFMIGEDEYKTWDTLPAFAKEQLEPRNVKCTIIQADPEDPNHFPGLEAIDSADELVLSVRRRPLPANDMARLKQFFDQGKGLVAIRTACHAFAGHGAKPQVQKNLVEWPDFDSQILGVHYLGHFANREGTEISRAADAGKNVLLEGIVSAPFHNGGTLYKFENLNPHATLLLEGTTTYEGNAVKMPVAWTYEPGKSRVFYTSLGYPDDFKLAAFNHLLVNAIYWTAGREQPTTKAP